MTSRAAATRQAAQAAADAVQALDDSLHASPGAPVTVGAFWQVIEHLRPVIDTLAELLPAYAGVLAARSPGDGGGALRQAFLTAAQSLRTARRRMQAAAAAPYPDGLGPQAGQAPGQAGGPEPLCAATAAASAAAARLKQLAGELAAGEVSGSRRSDDTAITQTGQCLYQAASHLDSILLAAAQLAKAACAAAGHSRLAPAIMRPLQDTAMEIRLGCWAIKRCLPENAGPRRGSGRERDRMPAPEPGREGPQPRSQRPARPGHTRPAEGGTPPARPGTERPAPAAWSRHPAAGQGRTPPPPPGPSLTGRT